MRNSISEYQLSDETDSGASIKILDRLGFNPFGELVDCYQHMSEDAPACSQWPNHAQPQTAKGQMSGMVFRADAGLCGILE